MAIININPAGSPKEKSQKSHNYSNQNARENLVNYIFDERKTPSRKYAFYNTPSSPQSIPNSFRAVAKTYDQEIPGRRHAEHFILSLSKKESETFGIDGLFAITDQFCSSFADEYQLAFAIHENDMQQLHSHIIINNVNYLTGRRMHKNKDFLNTQVKKINSYTNSYSRKKEKMSELSLEEFLDQHME